MEILKNETKCYFLIGGKEIRPENLSKNDLLSLFNEIYELEDTTTVEIPTSDMISSIKNPVEREIVSQIVQKIVEFTDNLEQIKQDIESAFPSLNSEN
ncbi:hypothetical protein [uncultured Ligilactobacillus sp.]|uniref:hypothetical protein n=1 Tax=uncultured Ligilactobacillus sp. TaxID=2837633 RepID=UPI00272A59EB|nr:hypothetical protein [uncultured Ligilactobacillus sp.]